MHSNKLGVLVVLPIALHAGSADAATILQEMNLITAAEATTSVLTTLADYSLLNPDGITNGGAAIGAGGISWSGAYSDAGWSYAGAGVFGGVPLTMNYTGILSGSDGTDVTVSFDGSGLLGSQPLLMNGTTTWLFDTGAGDYLTMEFAQQTKIGTDSFWGWVVGAEFLAGIGAGVVSGLIAGGAITLGTGGAGAPAGVAAGLKTGLIVGGAATVGATAVSAAVKTTLTPDPTPPPPPPSPPSQSDPFKPSNQGVLVADAGSIYADDLANRYRSSGSFTTTQLSGRTVSVPEPSGLSMLLAGLFGLLCVLIGSRRRAPGRRLIPKRSQDLGAPQGVGRGVSDLGELLAAR
ncbi:MAG: PEP-CTERM sorting domain-containing protein [Tistlia sp.]|uniref:PEP-CTERM sorting domain-containing protein n=1 Tax=Tistlia sp. TaxID=3057121 RepID=UPI0034A56531